MLSGTLTPAQARLERLRSLFDGCGLSPSDDFLDRTATEYGQIYRKAQGPSPGAVELLETLGRHPEVNHVAILTNHLRDVQIDKLEACGLTDLVDFMVTSEEVGHRKPSGQIFQFALGRAGTSAADAVMVGDSWEGDVQGAQAAGLRAVWFNARDETAPVDSLEGAPVPELRSFKPLELACRVILSR